MAIASSVDNFGAFSASNFLGKTSFDRSIRKVLISIAMACSLWSASAPLMATETVNINTDSAEVLSAGLQGIGLAKAYRIVEYRQAFGPFESVDELTEVTGIGEKIVDQNRSHITLD